MEKDEIVVGRIRVHATLRRQRRGWLPDVVQRGTQTWFEDFSDPELEASILSALKDQERDLRKTISDALEVNLGPGFRVEPLRLTRGSIEVLVTIIAFLKAVDVGYDTISKWKDFRDGLDFLAKDIEAVISSAMKESGPESVDSRITSATLPTVDARQLFLSRKGRVLIPSFVLAYLIGSHAVIFVVLLYFAVRPFLQP